MLHIIYSKEVIARCHHSFNRWYLSKLLAITLSMECGDKRSLYLHKWILNLYTLEHFIWLTWMRKKRSWVKCALLGWRGMSTKSLRNGNICEVLRNPPFPTISPFMLFIFSSIKTDSICYTGDDPIILTHSRLTVSRLLVYCYSVLSCKTTACLL